MSVTKETLRKECIEELLSYLTSQDEASLVWIWNDYCEKAGYYDDRVFCDYEFDDLFYGMRPSEVAEKTSEVNGVPEYFTFTIYGIDEWSAKDMEYEYRDVAEFFIDNGRSEDEGINDIINEYEEKLEELEEVE